MSQRFWGNTNFELRDMVVQVECPSNIALIKYWGKYEGQVPANPSISYTLNYCKTVTDIEFKANEPFSVKIFLVGKEEPKFAEKMEEYFRNIELYLPWILQGSFVIKTENTFPHSSGIASSASGFGAIARGLMEMDMLVANRQLLTVSSQKSSFLARLGSGSACRSLYNGLVVWGETSVVEGSSDLFAVPYPNEEIHPIFRDFNDWVLLIHEGEKSVSSSVGHALMNTNPYAECRFQEARDNFISMKEILKSGDLGRFIKLVEHEALTLHAMMMMSDPAFILMKTGTLEVINKIWKFREDTGLPLFFTLDAGANVHLLFPSEFENRSLKSEIEQSLKSRAAYRAEPNCVKQNSKFQIINFIETELLSYTQKGGVVKDFIKF